MNHKLCTLLTRFVFILLFSNQVLANQTSNPDNNQQVADLLYDEALVLMSANQNAAAIELLEQVVALQADHAGAWLDLAVVNCRIGNAAATQQQLELIETRFKPNPQIRLIIEQIQATDCAGYAKFGEAFQLTQGGELSGELTGILSGTFRGEFSLGIDDNVNQGLSNSSFFFNQGGNLLELQVAPGFRPREDEFAQADLSYEKQGLNAYLQMRQNATEDEFDLLSGFLGYQTKPYWEGLDVQFGAVLGGLTLGGSLYQTTYQLNSHIAPARWQTDSLGTRLVTAFSRVNYPGLAGADAEFIEVGLENIWTNTGYTLATRVDYTFDNALKDRAGGDRNALGYSAELVKPLEQDYTVRLGIAQRRTLGVDQFSPGFFDERRLQNRTSYSLAVSKALGKALTLKLHVRKVLNRENIDLFEFDNTVTRLSMLWNFN